MFLPVTARLSERVAVRCQGTHFGSSEKRPVGNRIRSSCTVPSLSKGIALNRERVAVWPPNRFGVKSCQNTRRFSGTSLWDRNGAVVLSFVVQRVLYSWAGWAEVCEIGRFQATVVPACWVSGVRRMKPRTGTVARLSVQGALWVPLWFRVDSPRNTDLFTERDGAIVVDRDGLMTSVDNYLRRLAVLEEFKVTFMAYSVSLTELNESTRSTGMVRVGLPAWYRRQRASCASRRRGADSRVYPQHPAEPRAGGHPRRLRRHRRHHAVRTHQTQRQLRTTIACCRFIRADRPAAYDRCGRTECPRNPHSSGQRKYRCRAERGCRPTKRRHGAGPALPGRRFSSSWVCLSVGLGGSRRRRAAHADGFGFEAGDGDRARRRPG